jgi:transposase
LEGELFALEKRYQETKDADERTRFQIIFLSHQGLSPPAIAKIVRRTPQGVRLIIHRYQDKGLPGLQDGRHRNPGRKPIITPGWESRLLELVEQDPRKIGVNRATWTAQLLADHLEEETGIKVSEARVRHYLYRHGYAPRRPTWTVAHKALEDSEYYNKKGRLRNC